MFLRPPAARSPVALLFALAWLSTNEAGAQNPGNTHPSNVLIFYMDDIGLDQLRGYDDINEYDPADGGYPYSYTPHIDALMTDGVRFTQARACPNCSPSRASMMSGRYPFRTGVGTIIAGELGQPGKDSTSANFLEFASRPRPKEFCIGHLCDASGYASGLFGKLHLQLGAIDGGSGDDYARHVLGFDTFRGTLRNLDNPPRPPGATTASSFTYYYWIEDGVRQTVGTQADPFSGEWATFHEHRRAAEWLSDEAQEPFVAIIASSDAHGPFQWPPTDDGVGHGFGLDPTDGDNAPFHINTRYRAKVETVDAAIGTVLSALSPSVRANTTIMVMADNGSSGLAFEPTSAEVRYPYGHPLWFPGEEVKSFDTAPYNAERLKGSAYEGGVRVPLIVSGPLVKHPGRSSHVLVDMVDIFETLRAIMEVAPNDVLAAGTLDGVSFLPILRGALDADHARVFSHGGFFHPNGVGLATLEQESQFYIRTDPVSGELWKVLQQRDPATGQPLPDEFFNLSLDPLETNNLGTAHAEYATTRAAFDVLLGS